MKTILVCLLFLLLAGSGARAAVGDADKEKCTCNLQIPGASKPGSRTVNAAACVRHDYQSWCDIYVAALEGARSHQQIVLALSGVGDPGVMTKLILELFDRAATAPAADPASKDRAATERKRLETILEKNAPQIATCVQHFKDRKVIAMKMDGATCSVGEQSQWLNITFQGLDRSVSILVAPL